MYDTNPTRFLRGLAVRNSNNENKNESYPQGYFFAGVLSLYNEITSDFG
jgi:hypothetical protein